MAEEADLSRAELIAKKAMELASRAEELARHAHEVAGVDEQLAALEAELAALAAEEESLGSGPGDDDSGAGETYEHDDWARWAETLANRVEHIGDRLADLVSEGVEAASATGFIRSGSGAQCERTVAVAGPVPVHVTTGGGSVRVVDGPEGEVSVGWRTKGHRQDGTDGVVVESRNEGIYVSVRDNFWRFRVVGLQLRVPRGSALDISTGGGTVHTSGTRGPVKIRTGGGSIHVADVDGPLSVHTGGGSIHVHGRLSGDSVVRTGGGSVSVGLERETNVEVDARGSNVRSSIRGLEGRGRRITGVVGTGVEGRLDVSTGGGSVRLARA